MSWDEDSLGHSIASRKGWARKRQRSRLIVEGVNTIAQQAIPPYGLLMGGIKTIGVAHKLLWPVKRKIVFLNRQKYR